MKLKCPACEEYLNVHYTCTNNHKYFMDEDVLRLTAGEFKEKLDEWLPLFHDFRSNHVKHLDFKNLPYSGVSIDRNIWKSRIQDLKVIDKLIEKEHKTILEVGSWNGWLANHLSQQGKDVTAIDHFIHELDGLKAKKFYTNSAWTSIQMDLEQPEILDNTYDVIILNRCLPYFTSPHEFIDKLRKKLSGNGILIITGINVASDKTKLSPAYQLASKEFSGKYKTAFSFKEMQLVITFEDIEQLTLKKYKVYPYPGFKNKLKHFLLRKRQPSYFAYLYG